MPKQLNKFPAAVLGFNAAEGVSLLDGNKTIALQGPDGFYKKVNVGDLILTMLSNRVAAKLAEKMTALSASAPGAVVRINPATPKDGDFKTVKPVLGLQGVVLSGQYEAYVRVSGVWEKIYPRV